MVITTKISYQWGRWICSKIYQYCLNDYEKVVTFGQMLISTSRVITSIKLYPKKAALNINVECFDLMFSSPITFAAFESHFDSIYLWLELGIMEVFKTIKHHPHSGNPRPRMQQVCIDNKEHLINALGLPGPGIDTFIQKVNHSKLSQYKCPIGLSIGGHSLSEYKAVMKTISKNSIDLQQLYFEINISCPNTDTGKSLHDNLAELETLLTYYRTLTNQVIFIKVSPDASNQNLCDIASLSSQFEKIAINAGNTQYRTCQSLELNSNSISIGGGGKWPNLI